MFNIKYLGLESRTLGPLKDPKIFSWHSYELPYKIMTPAPQQPSIFVSLVFMDEKYMFYLSLTLSIILSLARI